ncbi:MAG: hypothetical protein Q7S27_07135 [Nanoarchaeota archaeon]|nr:hypothetical protein [Nanoarchaeota archaeon]
MVNKKGAVELSIGTVVIIVLAMTMLILGLVLIRGIFRGATENVDDINEKVKEEIKNLFVDDSERAILKLTESTAKVKQGSEFGVAFGVKNTERGAIGSQNFQYTTILDDPQIKENCGVSKETAEKWIKFGSGSLSVRPGEVDAERIKVVVPEDSPLCETKYRILIYRSDKGESPNSPYADLSFFVKIESKGLF